MQEKALSCDWVGKYIWRKSENASIHIHCMPSSSLKKHLPLMQYLIVLIKLFQGSTYLQGLFERQRLKEYNLHEVGIHTQKIRYSQLLKTSLFQTYRYS